MTELFGYCPDCGFASNACECETSHMRQREPRSRPAKIARLRKRLDKIKQQSTHPLLGVVSGILDLLEDDGDTVGS